MLSKHKKPWVVTYYLIQPVLLVLRLLWKSCIIKKKKKKAGFPCDLPIYNVYRSRGLSLAVGKHTHTHVLHDYSKLTPAAAQSVPELMHPSCKGGVGWGRWPWPTAAQRRWRVKRQFGFIVWNRSCFVDTSEWLLTFFVHAALTGKSLDVCCEDVELKKKKIFISVEDLTTVAAVWIRAELQDLPHVLNGGCSCVCLLSWTSLIHHLFIQSVSHQVC